MSDNTIDMRKGKDPLKVNLKKIIRILTEEETFLKKIRKVDPKKLHQPINEITTNPK